MHNFKAGVTGVTISLIFVFAISCDDPTPQSIADAAGDNDGSERTDLTSDTEDTSSNSKGCHTLESLTVDKLVCDSSDSLKNVNWGEENFGTFRIPDDALSTKLPYSADELRNFYGEDVENGLSFGFNESHKLTGADVAYVEAGNDVTIHIAAVHDRKSYNTSTAIITTLLNFQGVQAEYENYNGPRTEIKEQSKGTSVRFPITEDVEQYDITIPAEEFAGPGRYSIGVTLSGVGEPNTGEFEQEFVVFYGGCRPMTLKCAEQGEVERRNEVETEMAELTAVDTFLYPNSGQTNWDPPENVVAAPGERLSFSFSTTIDNLSHTAVFVPLLDDVPQDQIIHMHLPSEPADLEPGKFVVGGRSQFELTAPEEPGTYRLELAQHVNPVISRKEAEGIGIGSLTFGLGSNSLTIEVQ
jgi:hypothetical protein